MSRTLRFRAKGLRSEAGSYLRLIDFVYHSTLGLRAIQKKVSGVGGGRTWVSSSSRAAPTSLPAAPVCGIRVGKVDVRLPGKGNSNSHGARPVHPIITMIKWIRTSRLSMKNCLSLRAGIDG